MSCYLIKHQNGMVSFGKVTIKGYSPIKVDGDFSTSADGFWSVFKRKVEYEKGMKFCLMVASDTTFAIDDDIEFMSESSLPKEVLRNILDEEVGISTKLVCKPELTFKRTAIFVPAKTIKDCLVDKQDNKLSLDEPSLQSYFKKKTNKINRDKR